MDAIRIADGSGGVVDLLGGWERESNSSNLAENWDLDESWTGCRM